MQLPSRACSDASAAPFSCVPWAHEARRSHVARGAAVTCNICETRIEPTQIVVFDQARYQEVDSTTLKFENSNGVSAKTAASSRDPGVEPANSRGMVIKNLCQASHHHQH